MIASPGHLQPQRRVHATWGSLFPIPVACCIKCSVKTEYSVYYRVSQFVPLNGLFGIIYGIFRLKGTFYATSPVSCIPVNFLPIIKKCREACDKIILKGCKRSSLNAPGSETPVSHSLLGVPFSNLLPLLLPSFPSLRQYEMVYYGWLGKKVEIFGDKISLTACKWSSLNAPGSETRWCHQRFVLGSTVESSNKPRTGRGGAARRQTPLNR